ncbi:PAS domain S-box protein [Peribacillus sp. SCS-155]|uniref:PAS domain S-box protein n=1 Tax=Peribacillus sedimenti TaxID=3115297 RepID=UPI00390654BF
MQKNKQMILYSLLGITWIYITNFALEDWLHDDGLFVNIQRTLGIAYIVILGWCYYYYLMKKKVYHQTLKDEQKLSTLINSMVDFVNFKDGEGRWLESNQFGLELFQLEGVDYKGKKDSELAQYSDFYGDALRYCEISDEETWVKGFISRCEEVIPLPDGGSKTFDTIKVPLFHQDGSRKALVVIGRDITERIKAEKRLSESQQQYRSLFEYNPDPIYMIDLNGIITNINPKFEELLGFSREDLLGTPVANKVYEIDKYRTELTEAFYHVIHQKKSVYNGDVRFVTKDGGSVLLYCTSVPMIIDDKVVGVIGYTKDVTSIRETEERLRKTEKLSVVGELAASVAHEIRNPLTALKGFVQLLQGQDTRNGQYFNIMLDELDRINHIVGELLVLAKPQQVKFREFDILHLVTDVKTLLESQANLFGSEISIDSPPPMPAILCEPNQLKQVFINIIKNSIEAEANLINISFEFQDSSILIKICDNGIGIETERMKHLGEPFYSSKEKGTGLGLTVTTKIVESHNGKISFESEINKGTEVTIELPVAVRVMAPTS